MVSENHPGLKTTSVCGIRELWHAAFFEPPTATGSEHFARQDSGLSQIFKLIVSTSKKRLNNIIVEV